MTDINKTPIEACRTIPPVVVEGYVEKGIWKEVGGLRTYVTGNEKSKKAVLDIYDIFGIAPQTLQGADGLAAALGGLVLVPDWFKGGGSKPEWYGELTPEQAAAKEAFTKVAWDFDANRDALLKYVEAAKKEWSGVESWGSFGLCWGGKVTVLASGKNTPFKASGQVHPGRLVAADAEAVTIPHIVLASKGEDVDVVQEYKNILVGPGKPNVVETYKNMHHGWMGARAKFDDPENLKEYERGYNELAAFFEKHL